MRVIEYMVYKTNQNKETKGYSCFYEQNKTNTTYDTGATSRVTDCGSTVSCCRRRVLSTFLQVFLDIVLRSNYTWVTLNQ